MYKTEFDRLYLEPAKFARRDAFSIMQSIGVLRVGQEGLAFEGFGIISFDEADTQHRYPIITKLDEFKPKANCLIFDCNKDPKSFNNGRYDKCVVYQNIGKNAQSYGFITWNDNTGRRYHNTYINYDVHDLFAALNRTYVNLNSIKNYYYEY